MKKKNGLSLSLIFSIIILFTVSFGVAMAYVPYFSHFSINKGFGGKVIHTKAIEIQTLENAGFVCTVPGETITIRPVGNYPTSYLIPYGVTSRNRRPLKSGSWILGKYNMMKTPITCTQEATFGAVTEIVNLNPLIFYGNS